MPDALVVPDSIDRQANLPPSAFECSWTDRAGDVAWVHLAGELDIATAPQLERTLRKSQARARTVVLDLRELVFMDVSGAHAIVNASLRAREAHRRLVVLRGPSHVNRVFALMGSCGYVEFGEVSSLGALIEEERA